MHEQRSRLVIGAVALAVLGCLTSSTTAQAAPADQVQIITTLPEIKKADVEVSLADATGRHASPRPAALPGTFPSTCCS